MADQRISIDASAGALDGTEIVPLVRVGSPVTAGSFAIGTAYVILSVGTTDFTLIGATSNTVGVGFVATGAGSGTGTAGATSNLRSTAQTIANSASVMVGDSGSGGTEGLVPAPGSGDAAAGKFLKADGTFAVPSGGGSSPPTSASTGLTTWANQGSATITDSASGIALTAPSNGNADNWRIRYKTAPSTPYAIKALIGLSSDLVTNHHVVAHVGFYDGTKLQGIGLRGNNTAGGAVMIDYETVPTVSSGSASDITYGLYMPNPLWFCVINDGSALHLGYSVDGTNFFMLVEHSLPDYMTTLTNVFFGIDPYATITAAILMDWQEFTNAGTVTSTGIRMIS